MCPAYDTLQFNELIFDITAESQTEHPQKEIKTRKINRIQKGNLCWRALGDCDGGRSKFTGEDLILGQLSFKSEVLTSYGLLKPWESCDSERQCNM